MNTFEVFSYMAQGNIGALTVLSQLNERPETGGSKAIVNLDLMDIRADKIWICYKDICNGDINELIKRANNRDPDMLKKLSDIYSGFVRRGEV